MCTLSDIDIYIYIIITFVSLLTFTLSDIDPLLVVSHNRNMARISTSDNKVTQSMSITYQLIYTEYLRLRKGGVHTRR